MEGGDSYHAAVTSGDVNIVTSAQTELKREYQLILDSGVVDPFSRKKQVIGVSCESVSEVSDASNSVVENATGCQIVSYPTCLGLRFVENPVTEISTSRGDFHCTSSEVPSAIEDGKSCTYYGVNGKLKIKFTRRYEPADALPRSALLLSHDLSGSAGHGVLVNQSLACQPLPGNGYDLDALGSMGRSQSTCHSLPRENKELKMSKKVSLDGLPMSVKKLLCSGLLDGQHIRYISTDGKVKKTTFSVC